MSAHLGLPKPIPQLVAAFLVIFLVGIAAPVHAADDSNSGQLAEVPTVTPQQLDSALSTLAQGTNDTQIQQLVSQLQSELNSGNYNAASSTLVQLQGLSANGGSQPLFALLQSLSIGSDGASINADTLSSLLSASSPYGPGTSGDSPQTLSLDMQSIANLMKYANSTLASELFQNSNALGGGALGGSGASPGNVSVALPGVSGLSGLSVPSIGAPSVAVGTPSAGVPGIPLAAFVAPIVAAVAVAAVFLLRGRIVRIVGSQSVPVVALSRVATDKGEAEGGAMPTDPRGRIEFYFWRAAGLMERRGVPKLECETHREFSAKCQGTPELPHVGTISSLYEKAKFSGESVGDPDADLAASEFVAMGKVER